MAMGRHWVALPSQRSMQGKLRRLPDGNGRQRAAEILPKRPTTTAAPASTSGKDGWLHKEQMEKGKIIGH